MEFGGHWVGRKATVKNVRLYVSLLDFGCSGEKVDSSPFALQGSNGISYTTSALFGVVLPVRCDTVHRASAKGLID